MISYQFNTPDIGHLNYHLYRSAHSTISGERFRSFSEIENWIKECDCLKTTRILPFLNSLVACQMEGWMVKLLRWIKFSLILSRNNVLSFSGEIFHKWVTYPAVLKVSGFRLFRLRLFGRQTHTAPPCRVENNEYQSRLDSRCIGRPSPTKPTIW